MERKKTGGRKMGTPNKVSYLLREKLMNIVTAELDRLPEYLDAIKKPEVKTRILVDLLPFVAPKLNSVDMEVTERETIIRIVRENKRLSKVEENRE